MRVIIAGCGRVGSQLARKLDLDGHEVVIIDKAERAFRRLGDRYGGKSVLGIAFDRETMEEASVTGAGAFVAVTSGDNSNVVCARLARERFGVERVVARIYDPTRARIYERYGITTIATAQWTSDTILAELFPDGRLLECSLGPGQGDVVILRHDLPDGYPSVPVSRMAVGGRSLVAAITRGGVTTVPASGELAQAGDRIHVAVQREAIDEVRHAIEAFATEETHA